MMVENFPCGTYAAYQRHRRRSEDACDPCKAANAARSREARADPEFARNETLRNNARIRALWRLAAEYPKRYHQLSTEELSKITFPEG